MRRGPGAAPLRRQLVLVASGVTAVAMLLLVLLVQLVLNRVVTGNIDTVLRDRAGAARTALEDADAGTSPSDLDDVGPGVVVFDAGGRRLAGAVPDVAADELARLGTVTAPTTVEVEEQVRLFAVPYTGATRTVSWSPSSRWPPTSEPRPTHWRPASSSAWSRSALWRA